MIPKGKYAIAGLGVTKQGNLPQYSTREVTNWAVNLALQDAGLPRTEVDGYIYVDEAERAVADCRYMGLTPKFHWAMMTGGATTRAMVMTAVGAIEAGLANYVICIAAGRPRSMVQRIGNTSYGISQVWGLFGAVSCHALHARRHMGVYGTTQEQLGAVVLAQREYANKRPDATEYANPLTMEDYLASPVISDPLHRYDCTRDADGGIAVIVTTAERARALKSKPVYIMGMGAGDNIRRWYDKRVYIGLDIAPAKEAAFKMAGTKVDDIDVAEFYDAFSINVIMQLEGYGFCGEGEGGPFVAEGNTKLSGKIPTDTGGGQLSAYYQQGFTPLAEGIRQLRGEGGATQVGDAKIALVSGHGANAGVQNTWAHSTLVLGV